MVLLCDLVTFEKGVTCHCNWQASELLSSSVVCSLVLERNEDLIFHWVMLSSSSFLGCASVLPHEESSDTCSSKVTFGGTTCAADTEPLAGPEPSFSFFTVWPIPSMRVLLVEVAGRRLCVGCRVLSEDGRVTPCSELRVLAPRICPNARPIDSGHPFSS